MDSLALIGGRYSELTIKNGEITGYMKPIFRGMNVYSRSQDAGKPLPHQVYEGLVGAVQTILQSAERKVGTKWTSPDASLSRRPARSKSSWGCRRTPSSNR